MRLFYTFCQLRLDICTKWWCHLPKPAQKLLHHLFSHREQTEVVAASSEPFIKRDSAQRRDHPQLARFVHRWFSLCLVDQYQCIPRLIAPGFVMAHCQPWSHLGWDSHWMSRSMLAPLLLSLDPSASGLRSPRRTQLTCIFRPMDPVSACCLVPDNTRDNWTRANSLLLVVSQGASPSVKSASQRWMWDTSCKPSQLATLLASRTSSVASLRPADIESSRWSRYCSALLHHSVGEYWAQWTLASPMFLYRIS